MLHQEDFAETLFLTLFCISYQYLLLVILVYIYYIIFDIGDDSVFTRKSTEGYYTASESLGGRVFTKSEVVGVFFFHKEIILWLDFVTELQTFTTKWG